MIELALLAIFRSFLILNVLLIENSIAVVMINEVCLDLDLVDAIRLRDSDF